MFYIPLEFVRPQSLNNIWWLQDLFAIIFILAYADLSHSLLQYLVRLNCNYI